MKTEIDYMVIKRKTVKGENVGIALKMILISRTYHHKVIMWKRPGKTYFKGDAECFCIVCSKLRRARSIQAAIVRYGTTKLYGALEDTYTRMYGESNGEER